MTPIATVIYEDASDERDAESIAQYRDRVARQWSGIEKLPGTYPFTLDRSVKGYRLNAFLHRLVEPEFRQRFLGNPEPLFESAALTEQERDMMRSAGATGPGCQPPAAEAHVDFTERTARKLADRLYQQARPQGAGYERFIAFSLWRALSPAPQDWPLALCDGRSVGPDEGTRNTKVDVDVLPEGDALFAPIDGEDDMVAATIFHHRPGHRWWYFPDMSSDEVVLIKFHDSDHGRTWRAPHTAFHDSTRADAVTRVSYEFRGFAFFEGTPPPSSTANGDATRALHGKG